MGFLDRFRRAPAAPNAVNSHLAQAAGSIAQPRAPGSLPFTAPTGTIFNGSWSQYLQRNEPNPDLLDRGWWGDLSQTGVANQMVTYSYVAAILESVRLPIAQARKVFVPKDAKDAVAVEVADLFDRSLNERDKLSSWFVEFMDYLIWGWCPWVIERDTNDGMPKNFYQIQPRWTEARIMESGINYGLTYRDVSGQTMAYASQYLFWPRHMPRYGNMYGTPWIRPMYKHWREVIELSTLRNLYAQSASGSILEVRPPATEQGFDPNNNPIDRKTQQSVAEAYSQQTPGAINVKVPPPGFEASFVANTGSHYDFDKAIEQENKNILLAGLGQILALGVLTSGGAYALGKEQRALMTMGIKARGAELANQFIEQVLKPTVALLYGAQYVDRLTPSIKYEGLDDDNATEQIGAIVNALSGGAIDWDETIDAQVRNILKLPSRINAVRPPPKPAPVNPFASAASAKFSAATPRQQVVQFANPRRLKLLLDTQVQTASSEVDKKIVSGRSERAATMLRYIMGESDVLPKGPSTDGVATIYEGQILESAQSGYDEANLELERQRRGTPFDAIQEARQDESVTFAKKKPMPLNLQQEIRERARAAALAKETAFGSLLAEMYVKMGEFYREKFGLGQVVTLDEVIEKIGDRERYWSKSVASETAAQAFNEGRRDLFEEQGESIEVYEQSAILDDNACAECLQQDGNQSINIDDLVVPVPNCASAESGANRCRCMILARSR